VKIAVIVAIIAVTAGAAAALYAELGPSADAGGIEIRLTPTVKPTKTPSKTPAATPTKAAPVPWSYPAAAGPGVYGMECVSPTSVRVFLLWNPSRAGVQFLDVSNSNTNFAPGTFRAYGPLGRDGWGYIIEGLQPETYHTARVNTYTGSTWAASGTLEFRTPNCGGQESPVVAADMAALRDRLGGAIYGSGLNAAVAITDLQTGETIDINGNDVRLPGCTINLFALIATAQTLQDGRYAESSAGELIGGTINRSDPITARRLMKDWVGGGNLTLGLERVNTMMEALGMTSTLLDHPPAYPHESLNGGINNRITALDANRGLRELWDGHVLGPYWRDYMLQKMTLVKPGLQYIIGSAGYGATRSHKNGFLWEQGWSDNDIGIVWFERGGQRYGYAISFYSQYLRGKWDAIPLGQRVAALAYDWFVGRYGYP
jgi:beta-lactamase class A